MGEISEERLIIEACHTLPTGCKNINKNMRTGKNISYKMVLPLEKATW